MIYDDSDVGFVSCSWLGHLEPISVRVSSAPPQKVHGGIFFFPEFFAHCFALLARGQHNRFVVALGLLIVPSLFFGPSCIDEWGVRMMARR